MKRSTTAVLLSLVTLSIIAGCSATEAELEQWRKSWIGKSRDQVILANGVPQRSTTLSDGVEIFEYTQVGETTGTVVYGQLFAETPRCETRYFISKEGVVTKAQIWGDCVVNVK